jgi:hypothetical protein
MSRRELVRAAGIAAGAALLPRAHADEPRPAAPATAPKPAKLPPASQSEADARVAQIVARWGARLSPAERADLARLSADAQQALDAVRAFALDNRDEPALVFHVLRRSR